MNKKELVFVLAEANDETKKSTSERLEQVIELITDTLADGENVELYGFGKFKLSERKAYTARNPQTGAPVEVPAKKVVTFKPAKRLKDAVKG